MGKGRTRRKKRIERQRKAAAQVRSTPLPIMFEDPNAGTVPFGSEATTNPSPPATAPPVHMKGLDSRGRWQLMCLCREGRKELQARRGLVTYDVSRVNCETCLDLYAGEEYEDANGRCRPAADLERG